jgi:NAD(P)-dependent dehydrogenase (short-subunit alcohol dehydrogenase family)
MGLRNDGGRLAGKTAVITGGTSGIGLATAHAFLAQGARVLVTGQNPARVEAAAQELGEGATAVVADVRSPEALDALAEQVRTRFGGLDVLFANAGVGRFAPLEAVDESFFDDQFDTNVRGVFFTVQKLRPLLRPGSSVVLNASAVHGKGSPGAHVYFASKAAVRSLARSLAAELAPARIRVNAVSPGLVPTNFSQRWGCRLRFWRSSRPASKPALRSGARAGRRRSPMRWSSWPATRAPTSRPPTFWSTAAG